MSYLSPPLSAGISPCVTAAMTAVVMIAVGRTTTPKRRATMVLTNSSLVWITVVSSPTCLRKYCHSSSSRTSKNHGTALAPGGRSAL